MKKGILYILYQLKYRLSDVNKFKKWGYAGRRFVDIEEYNTKLYDLIESGHPFMVARYGTVELNCMKAFEFGLAHTYIGNMACMAKQAGFFPTDFDYGLRFTELMKLSSQS